MAEPGKSPGGAATTQGQTLLFVACFTALVATSFSFIIRVLCMDAWQVGFGLSETQKGEIFGAGMWPFGLSIVIFSLIIDKVGYGKSMIFAFACHAVSAILLLSAKGYWGLYAGSILNGLAAGTVEAVINPAIASAYTKMKTKMLTILHAGWPAGMVLAGIPILLLGLDWQVRVAIIFIPVLAYGLLLLKAKFPVSERVVAGVSYREMLAEPGAIGCLIVLYLVCMEFNRVFGLGNVAQNLPCLGLTILIGVVTLGYLLYTRSLGRPMYILLLIVMLLLATTELGVDTWVSDLMKKPMAELGLPGGLLLIYMQVIMMVLRFCIGPIERALKPLGVLFTCSVLAAIGLFFLSQAAGVTILIAATVYGVGKTFFWPVTLGLCAERFPRGGALTLNAVSGCGMLGVGIIGSQILGYWQDTSIDRQLLAQNKDAHVRLMAKEEKSSVFGTYKSLNQKAVNEITDKLALAKAREGADPAKLAADPMYQTLVRNAYDHLVRKEGDAEAKSFDIMNKALADANVFVDKAAADGLAKDDTLIGEVTTESKRSVMGRVAALPAIMAVCYLGLILYFMSKGGYKAIDLMAEKGAH